MEEVAIIGMQCRLPGADNVEEFWSLLLDEKDVIETLNKSDLPTSTNSEERWQNTNYVARAGCVNGIELFDADFFEYTPAEAEIIDPQARLLMELSWEALELSGCAGEVEKDSIGVYASAGISNYLLRHIMPQQEKYRHKFQEVVIGNAPDCLATRISYKLGLTGPSLTIQSGCSSSLVAMHHARIALLTHQCNVALVAAASLNVPQREGYIFTPGGFLSHDGRCRPFSKEADGTIFTSGAAVIVLKRASEAKKRGNPVIAVIKSSAINNDGKSKASFTAPSIDGQAEVIMKAQRLAQVPVETISYIEAHGTATPIGDPIEVEALTKAFGLQTKNKQFCGLGSVKSNVGHTDVAAGLVSLLKVCLALKHQIIPATLYYGEANPKINFENTPFYVCAEQQVWSSKEPRRAGISSFGFGGTNVHMILEESAPVISEGKDEDFLFVLSAKTEAALAEVAKKLMDYVQSHNEIALQNIAYTLQMGRFPFTHRTGFIAGSLQEVIKNLSCIAGNMDVISTSDDGNSIGRLKECLHAWVRGEIPDFLALYEHEKPSIIALPTYPFSRKRYWIDAVSVTEKNIDREEQLKRNADYRQWYYKTSWLQTELPIVQKQMGSVILFATGDSILPDLVSFLQKHKNCHVLCVYPAALFSELENGVFTICPNEAAHYVQLLKKISEKGFRLDHIVHGFSLLSDPNRGLDMGFDSLLHLIQALINFDIKVCKRLDVLTEYSCDVMGEEALNPCNATLHAMTRVIQQEYPHIKTRCIDITECHDLVLLSNELASDTRDDIVAYRGKHRWTKSYQQVGFDEPKTTSKLINKGTYIILGGLGNVGLVHAQYLAKSCQANLVLVTRSDFPPPEQWGAILKDACVVSSVAKNKIAILVKILSYGSTIEVVKADITDKIQLSSVFRNLHQRFYKVDGVIHAAGARGELHYKPLAEITASYCKEIFLAKLTGIQVLHELVEEHQIDFCLIVSSISATLAGLGLCVYSASHDYLNCFVHLQQHIKRGKWYALSWDAWNLYKKEQGPNDSSSLGALGSALDKFTISEDEGERILAYAMEHLNDCEYVISTSDLVLRHRYWVKNEFDIARPERAKELQIRPDLAASYIKPSSPMQQQLSKLWSDLLGIGPIGIQDNFFELGGHSLMAIEMINNINQQCQASLSIIDLFDHPSIEKLAILIQSGYVDDGDSFASKIQQRAKQQRDALSRKSHAKLI